MKSILLRLQIAFAIALFPLSVFAQQSTPNDQEIFYQCFAQQKVDGYTSPEFCRCVSDLSINRLNPEDYARAISDYRYISQLQNEAISSLKEGNQPSEYKDSAGRIISDCIPCQETGSLDCVAELDQARLWSDYQAIASNLRNGYFDRIRTGRSYSRFFADTSIIATNFCKPIIEYPMEFWTETVNRNGSVISRTNAIRIDSRLEEEYGRHMSVWANEAVTNSFADFFQSVQRQEISFRALNEALWMIQLRQGLANHLGDGCAPGDTFHDTYKNMIRFELGQQPRIPRLRAEPIGMAIDGIDEARLSRAMATIETRQKERQAALTASGPLNCNWDQRWEGPSTISGDPAGSYKATINGETVHFALYPRADLLARGDNPIGAYQGLGVIAGTKCIATVTLSGVAKGTGTFTLSAHSNTGALVPCEESQVFRTPIPGRDVLVVNGLNGAAETNSQNGFAFKLNRVRWVSQSTGQCSSDAVFQVEPARMTSDMIEMVEEYENSVIRADSSISWNVAPDGFWASLSE